MGRTFQTYKLLYSLYFLNMMPLLVLLVGDVFSEWELATQQASNDAPQHAAMAALVQVALPYFLATLSVVSLLSLYVFFVSTGNQRVRIGVWYTILLLVATATFVGPHAHQFPSRLAFSFFQVLCIAPLVLLPLYWLFSESNTR